MFLQSSKFTMTRRDFFVAALLVISPALGEPIRRVDVESTNLKSVGFDPKTKILEVEFLHGGVYRYFEVPTATHDALMKAQSKGKYFQANVRNKFRFERVSNTK